MWKSSGHQPAQVFFQDIRGLHDRHAGHRQGVWGRSRGTRVAGGMGLGTRMRPQRLCQMLGERPREPRGGTGGGEDWGRGRASGEAEDARGEGSQWKLGVRGSAGDGSSWESEPGPGRRRSGWTRIPHTDHQWCTRCSSGDTPPPPDSPPSPWGLLFGQASLPGKQPWGLPSADWSTEVAGTPDAEGRAKGNGRPGKGRQRPLVAAAGMGGWTSGVAGAPLQVCMSLRVSECE